MLDYSDESVLTYSDDFQKNVEECLDAEIAFIIEPIIHELKTQNLKLSYEEFILVADHLYKVINVNERRKLINWYVMNVKRENSNRRTRPLSHEYSFKPMISENSSLIYNNSKRITKNVMLRNSELIGNKERFSVLMNEAKERDEVKGKC